MTTSMYFSAERIQVLQGKFHKGKLRVDKAFNEPLPEGTMINGVITNEVAVTRALVNISNVLNLKKQFIDLVVDSSSILTKRLCVPVLPEKKLLALVASEFTEVSENYEELIYDYGVIARKNPQGEGGVILCSAMENTFAFGYIDIFNKLKLRLNSIDIAVSASIGLAGFIPDFQEKTFIISVLESNTLVSYLFVQGQYYYTGRNRLLANRGSQESIGEIAKAISALIQFNQSQKTESDITEVYFCGLRADEYDLIAALSETYAIEISPMPDFPQIEAATDLNYRLAHNFYVTGNLLIKDGSYHG